MHYAIISTIVRDDDAYLDEWVRYHLKIGFDHIVIYDHKSIKPVKPIWDKKVSVFRINRENPLLPHLPHNDTLKNFKTKFLSLLDADEFIVLHEHDDIRDLLKNYEKFGGLAINYILYGSSGHIKKPEGRVIDNYLWRTPSKYAYNRTVKTILNTAFTKSIYNQHAGVTTRKIVHEDFSFWNSEKSSFSNHLLCRINHYYTRSREEWLFKMNRANKQNWNMHYYDSIFHEIDKNSIYFDPILRNFKI